MSAHSERKHSKFSASGAERWLNCPGEPTLSEGLPDIDNKWSLEGTKAHEVLEQFMLAYKHGSRQVKTVPGSDHTMRTLGFQAANFMAGMHKKLPGSEFYVETRISLPFIHPDMFGTFDGAVVEHFGELNVFDYKYGVGHVSPVKNYQMIFYGLGLAWKYDWNFSKVKLWVIQPRIRGYEGPAFWELDLLELKKYINVFKQGIERVEKFPTRYTEGPWCHWCKAKTICPLKNEVKRAKAKSIFLATPIT